MININKLVLEVVGLLILILSCLMLVPAIIDFFYDSTDWKVFIFSSFLGIFLGGNLYILNKKQEANLSTRNAFILTSFSWVLLCLIAAVPFHFSYLNLSITDAVFESVSGLASCGATVIEGLKDVPKGILMWRALLNWIGGVGIILIAMTILPVLKVGGMGLLKAEYSDRSDKILPRARHIAAATFVVYCMMTFFCIIALMFAGMNWFDAVCHALGAISTGGFGNYDENIGYFNSVSVEVILMITMILSAMPFVNYIKMAKGDIFAIFKDTQSLGFLFILFLFVFSAALWMAAKTDLEFTAALRLASFNLSSVMTTTGFSSGDTDNWGVYPTFILIIAAFVGGCSGSTAGGIKIFRLQVLWQVLINYLKQLIYPNRVTIVSYDHKAVTDKAIMGILIFFYTYMLMIVCFIGLMSIDGVEFVPAVKAVVFSLADAGFGIGGKYVSYASLGDLSKWSLSAAMIVGRLEFFTILVLLMPSMWKK